MKTINIRVMDLVFLYQVEERAQNRADLGYVGAGLSAPALLNALNRYCAVSLEAVEASLFSLQELERAGLKITYPDGMNRASFIKRVLPSGYILNKDLSTIEKRSE